MKIMARGKAMVYNSMIAAESMKVNGSMIKEVDKDLKLIRMVQNTWVAL